MQFISMAFAYKILGLFQLNLALHVLFSRNAPIVIVGVVVKWQFCQTTCCYPRSIYNTTQQQQPLNALQYYTYFFNCGGPFFLFKKRLLSLHHVAPTTRRLVYAPLYNNDSNTNDTNCKNVWSAKFRKKCDWNETMHVDVYAFVHLVVFKVITNIKIGYNFYCVVIAQLCAS